MLIVILSSFLCTRYRCLSLPPSTLPRPLRLPPSLVLYLHTAVEAAHNCVLSLLTPSPATDADTDAPRIETGGKPPARAKRSAACDLNTAQGAPHHLLAHFPANLHVPTCAPPNETIRSSGGLDLRKNLRSRHGLPLARNST
ncbi:hypothetical protein C8R43DRAFT_1141789 [Mycena crocata]|nr:hypothetical protein C8R43DRAFT_1141789 [Mycena crocata]